MSGGRVCDNMGQVGAHSKVLAGYRSIETRSLSVCRDANFHDYNQFTNSLVIGENLDVTDYPYDTDYGTVINAWVVDDYELGDMSPYYNDPTANVGYDGYYAVPNTTSYIPSSFHVESHIHVLAESTAGTRSLMMVLHRDNADIIVRRDDKFPSADPTVPTSLYVSAPATNFQAGDIITINFNHTAPSGNVIIMPGEHSMFSVKKNLVH